MKVIDPIRWITRDASHLGTQWLQYLVELWLLWCMHVVCDADGYAWCLVSCEKLYLNTCNQRKL